MPTYDWLAMCKRYREGVGLTPELAVRVRKSLDVLVDAFRLYEGSLVLSFNGGKDATAMLFLSLAARAEWLSSYRDGRLVPSSAAAGAAVVPGLPTKASGGASGAGASDEPAPAAAMRAIYFPSKEGFPELDAFVQRMVRDCDLQLLTYEGVGFVDGLKDCIDYKGGRAFVLGTRHTDPAAKAGLGAFAPSSKTWPAFMRVNPIVEWDFGDIWVFLRAFGVPYCALYDQGYTSLGAIESTKPNPALQRPDGSYAPAYELAEAGDERRGRGRVKTATAPVATKAEEDGKE